MTGLIGGSVRVAAFLDVENLLYASWVSGRLGDGIARLGELLGRLRDAGQLVLAEAVSHHHLAVESAAALGQFGIRLFRHRGGPDAADIELTRRMRQDVPASCSVVILGSGDHYFVPVVQELRAKGITVIVVAHASGLSGELAAAADLVVLLSPITGELAA